MLYTNHAVNDTYFACRITGHIIAYTLKEKESRISDLTSQIETRESGIAELKSLVENKDKELQVT